MPAAIDGYLNFAAAITVALIGAATTIYVARREQRAERRAHPVPVHRWVLASLVLVISTLTVGSVSVLLSRIRVKPSATTEVLRFTFENGHSQLSMGRVVDSVRQRVGDIVGPPSALSLSERHGGGHALTFPATCAGSAGDCPPVFVQVFDVADLNPETRDFVYGADVQVQPTEAGLDSTVMEKGRPDGTSEWKLKIEESGRASCVVVTQSREASFARSWDRVVDGSWHSLACRRTATALTILVDGIEQGRDAIDAGATVHNEDPLRMGGYRLHASNNQFHGAMDNVYFGVPET